MFTLFIVVLLAAPQGPVRLGDGAEGLMTTVTAAPARNETGASRSTLSHLAPFLGMLALALILPLISNDYWALIGTRAAIYWVLVAGLNLVVGFAGHLAIGYVALLTLGAYTTSVLVAGNVLPPVPVFAALPIAACVGAVFGVIVGLPALRFAHVLFRDVDARLCHHRDADRAGLAERHRSAASALPVRNSPPPSTPRGAIIISASALPR